MKIVAFVIAVVSLLVSTSSYAGTSKWDAIYLRDSAVTPATSLTPAKWEDSKTRFIAQIELDLSKYTATEILDLKKEIADPAGGSAPDANLAAIIKFLTDWKNPEPGPNLDKPFVGWDKLVAAIASPYGLKEWFFNVRQSKKGTTPITVLEIRFIVDVDDEDNLDNLDAVLSPRIPGKPDKIGKHLKTLKQKAAISNLNWAVLEAGFDIK